MIIVARERNNEKISAKNVRKAGKIPAVVYGFNTENVNVEVEKSNLMSILRKSRRNDKFELNVEDKGNYNVIIKNLQKNPVTGDIIHIDFYNLSKERPISVKVPVEIVGESLGVKMGGDLYQPRKTVTITALPDDIPDAIKVDVSGTQIGDVVHIYDIDLPEGVKVKTTKNFTVAAILGKAQEEEAEEEEEELAEEPKEESKKQEG